MSEMPDVSEKAFHCMLQELATILHSLYTAEKENKTHFCEFDESNDSLDEFFMRCLSDIVWFKVASVVNIKLFFYGLILLWCDNIN